MTCTRAGVGATGCNPITNEERVKWYRARFDAWLLLLPPKDAQAEEMEAGRRAAVGIAFKKALRKRKRVKLRQRKATKNNVVPIRRHA